MPINIRIPLSAAAYLVAGLGLSACDPCLPGDEEPSSSCEEDEREVLVGTRAQARIIAAKAYVYGFPLVLNERTRQVFTAVPEPSPDGAPMNQLSHAVGLPDASFRTVVRPNRDTVYSSAYLDLSAEPLVLSVPDVEGDRFTLFAMLDAWTNAFAAPGTRTNDNQATTYAIVGPDYDGPIPDELTPIRAPTDLVWMIGRIEVFSELDMANVADIQAEIDLRPLSAYGGGYTPAPGVPDDAIDRETPPLEQVLSMSAREFFGELAELLAAQRPSVDDAPLLEELRAIGIEPGGFDYDALPPHIREGLAEGLPTGQNIIDLAKADVGLPGSPWSPSADVPLGDYGTEYLTRAVVAQIGLGANRREDAVYFNASRGPLGGQLDASKREYSIHFEPGELPPVGAFWSISMYDSEGYFVDNPIDRYVVGSHEALELGPDGSLDIRIQATAPLDAAASNWLPAPEGPFELTLRAYWPSEAIIDGSWTPPTVLPLP
ncbi:hypothetical protein PPSIR1_11410 [Plesiocystis pacifica SIR-1]|uniref:DUF1254 domain-containing protein n=1 Tax=Plesiocystis pacifica SIR-1 TaxID=391625 RepID=A6G185_9BACT|nr:DUF1254 domain-containing protein [Plesiocystis pacifica]EDM80380.1 hypothetical protein PPSIR1_11410 [Plesiocystis pacifica SIR-1]